MFATGEYVVYGHTGICKVMGVTTMNMDGISKDRLYYVLQPDGRSEGSIFTPVENGKQVLRKMITKDQAEELFAEIPSIEAIEINDNKQREEQYKQCLKSCDCRELIRVIKTIHQRKKIRLAQGRKVTATDEKYLKMAEEKLYSELSVLLEIPKRGMEEYIINRIEHLSEKK
jgi:CarD family transcriptional regulator